jgi:transcriptional regulator with XRE-family HTH domain
VTTPRGPAVLRRRLGSVLKRLRGEKGLHLDAVARQLEISPSKLSRLETGQVTPKLRDVRDLLLLYQAPEGLQDRMMRWAHEAKEPGWWHPFSAAIATDLDVYISLEVEARKIRIYSLPISGLLQTEAYARMLLAGAAPTTTQAELERLIEIRIGRQTVLEPHRSSAPPLELHAILDEYSLWRGGDTEIMRGQLETLLVRATWSNVTLQLLPFEAGFTRGNGTFAIFEPREVGDGAVVNVESTGQDTYFETPSELVKYEAIWADVLDRCLDPDQTRAHIERLLREHHRRS